METAKKGRPEAKRSGQGTIYEVSNGKSRDQLTVGYNENGSPKRRLFIGKTKREVLDKMKVFYVDNNRDLLPTDDRITLSEWFYTWLFTRRIHDLKASSFERYEGPYRSYIESSSLGKIKLIDLRTHHIQTYYNSLVTEKGKSPSTIKTINKYSKSCLNQALKEGYITRSYHTLITPPKGPESPKEIINISTLEEQQTLMKKCMSNRSGMLYILVLGTGLKFGGILALKWTDTNFKDNYIDINKTIKSTCKIDSKGNREFQIIEQQPRTKNSIKTASLNNNLIESLQQHRKKQMIDRDSNIEIYFDNNLVFSTPIGNYLNESNVRRAFKRILKKCSLKELRFHDLRHTFATRLFESGVLPKTVQTILGHSDVSTTLNIYIHVMKDIEDEAIDKLDFLFKLGENLH